MFSDALIALYQKIGEASNYQERRDAMIDLATQYAREHDDTDQEVNEEFHQLVEEFEIAHKRLSRAALSLGRAVTMALDVDENRDSTSLPAKPPVSPGGNLPN